MLWLSPITTARGADFRTASLTGFLAGKGKLVDGT
jgi:hypothetical protein